MQLPEFSKKTYIIGIVSCIGLAFFAGRYSAPTKISTSVSTQSKSEDKKIVDAKVTDNTNKKDIQTTITIQKKDGSIVTKKIIDHSTQTKQTKQNKETNIVKREENKTSTKVIDFSKPNWSISALYSPYPIPTVFDYKELSIGVGYRVFSNIWVISEVNGKQEFKVGLRLDF